MIGLDIQCTIHSTMPEDQQHALLYISVEVTLKLIT